MKKMHGKEIKAISLEQKEGRHDSSRSALGLNHHTHYEIYQVTYKVERTFMIDFDGTKTYTSDWMDVPNSKSKSFLRRGKERGYTSRGERPINETISIEGPF